MATTSQWLQLDETLWVRADQIYSVRIISSYPHQLVCVAYNGADDFIYQECETLEEAQGVVTEIFSTIGAQL